MVLVESLQQAKLSMCEITTFSANYKDNALKLKHTPLYPHAIFRCFSCFSLCPVEGALWWALLFRCFMKKRVHLGCEVHGGSWTTLTQKVYPYIECVSVSSLWRAEKSLVLAPKK